MGGASSGSAPVSMETHRLPTQPLPGQTPNQGLTTTSFSRDLRPFQAWNFSGFPLHLHPFPEPQAYFRNLGLSSYILAPQQTGLQLLPSLSGLFVDLAESSRLFNPLTCCPLHVWRPQDWWCVGRLHPFPQHFEASSTTPSTGEAVTPAHPPTPPPWVFPSWLSWACEFEKGEEVGKEHLASLVNSVCEEVSHRGNLLACFHTTLRVRGGKWQIDGREGSCVNSGNT